MTGFKVNLKCRSCNWSGSPSDCRVLDMRFCCPSCGGAVYDPSTSIDVVCPICKWTGISAATVQNVDGHDNDGCPKCGAIVKEK